MKKKIMKYFNKSYLPIFLLILMLTYLSYELIFFITNNINVNVLIKNIVLFLILVLTIILLINNQYKKSKRIKNCLKNMHFNKNINSYEGIVSNLFEMIDALNDRIHLLNGNCSKREEFINSFFESMPIPVIIVSPKDKTIIKMNNSAIQLYGNEEYKHCYNFIKKKKDECFDETNICPLELSITQKSFVHIETLHIDKNGNDMLMSVYCYPLFFNNNPDKIMIYFIDQSTDIKKEIQKHQLVLELKKMNTDLENALLKAQESNKMKSEFLAMMSHEIRTPLGAMLGFSELLLVDESLNEDQKENVNMVYESGKRLLHILNNLLELSIIEAGKIVINYNKFRISKVIDDISVLLQEKLNTNNNCLYYKVECDENIYSDELRITQILFNLIGNAAKFTENGYIMINIRITCNEYIFSVKDTGPGISESERERIFNMFTRGKINGAKVLEGVGLGLAICEKLVHALNGEIYVKSKLGEGSEFIFSLPVLK